MRRKSTRLRNIPSDDYVSVASTSISDANSQGLLVRCVKSLCMFTLTRRLACMAFSSARTVLGFMPALFYLTFSKRRSNLAGFLLRQITSTGRWTKSPAPYSPKLCADASNTRTFPEANAKPNIIDGNIIIPGIFPPPSNLGRWCEHCQDYKRFARLERRGDRASTVDYVPRCITCDHILLPVPPGEGF